MGSWCNVWQYSESANMQFILNFLSIKGNSIRLGGPVHGIVIKTVFETLLGVVGVEGGLGW